MMEQEAASLPPVTEPPKPRTFEEMLAEASDEIRESYAESLENITERKDAAIAILRANKNCPLSEEELRTWTAKKLEQLAVMSGAVVTNQGPDYRGKGLAIPRTQIDPDSLPPDPPKTAERVLERQKQLGKGAYFR